MTATVHFALIHSEPAGSRSTGGPRKTAIDDTARDAVTMRRDGWRLPVLSVVVLSLAWQTASPPREPVEPIDVERAILDNANRSLDAAAASVKQAAAAPQEPMEPCYLRKPEGPFCPATDRRRGPIGPSPRHVPLEELIDKEKDYPAFSIRVVEEGDAILELAIDTVGRVSNCRVRESSGSAVLDSTSCRFMRSRGWFWPALDESGRPVASTFEHKIEWKFPAGMRFQCSHVPCFRLDPLPPGHTPARRLRSPVVEVGYPEEALGKNERSSALYRVWMDETGRVIRCIVMMTSGSTALDEATCEYAMKDSYAPQRDENGAGVPSILNHWATWKLAEDGGKKVARRVVE